MSKSDNLHKSYIIDSAETSFRAAATRVVLCAAPVHYDGSIASVAREGLDH